VPAISRQLAAPPESARRTAPKIMLSKLKEDIRQGKTLLQFGFLRSLGQALAMVTPLVVAKFFSEELFGSYALSKMIVFFFATFFILSSRTPFIVFANQERTQSGKINKAFSIQLLFIVCGISVFALLVFPLSPYVIRFANIDMGDLWFVMLAFLGLSLKMFVCNLFLATGERIKNSLAEFSFGVISLVLILGLYVTDRIGFRSIFAVDFVAAVLLIVIFGWTINRSLIFPFDLDRKVLRGMFDFAKWAFIGATAVYMVNWGDNLVLRYFVSIEQIGVYNLGYQLFKGIVILVGILGPYFLPFISENIHQPEKIRQYLWHKRPKILAAGFAGLMITFVCAPFLLDLLYAESYQGSENVFRLLLIAAAVAMYNIFYMPLFNAAKHYKILYISNVLQVFINVVLNIVFIPLIGILGAAVATVFAYGCRTLAIELYFRFKLKKSLGIC